MRFLATSAVALATLLILCNGCSHPIDGVGFLPAGSIYNPSTTKIYSKIDILFVVDNSGSMAASQTGLTSSFNNFINTFITKGYDFRIAVTTSEAYKANAAFAGNPIYAQFNDVQQNTTANVPTDSSPVCTVGGPYTSCSGISNIFTILSSQTAPPIPTTFSNNAMPGVVGSGDERVMSSVMETLSSTLPANEGFLRPDSFFAVIFISDEDDFSSLSRTESSWSLATTDAHYYPDHQYTSFTNTSGKSYPPDAVLTYENYLDALTGTTGSTRRYNVSTIGILDNSCMTNTKYGNGMASGAGGAYTYPFLIGQRMIQMSNDLNGVTASICSPVTGQNADFSGALNNIQTQILALATQFYLQHIPQVNTLYVAFNGVTVPNDPTNGWTYLQSANSILFHGSYLPQQNTQVLIDYLPQ